MRIQKCKGTRDLSPGEMLRFRQVESVFRNICLARDYKEIRTPTIEYLHLFTSAGTLTPSTLSKVYSFLDWDGWSGERVVLRPDGTIPVARAYIDNMSAEKLARLFYVTNIFIFEETGKESRERWQCGVELIGADSITSDIELISIAMETLQNLGLKNIELKLSHAGIIRALLTGFRLSKEEQSKIFDQILDGDATVLNQLRDGTPELARLLTPLLDLKGESSGFLKNLRAVFTQKLLEFRPALDNFIAVTDLLTSMGYSYEIDIASGRGFEYYTGLIFQLFAGKIKIGGGGRYNDLIPLMGGGNVPASGFALYLDPLIKFVRPTHAAPDKISVTVEDEQTGLLKVAFQAMQELREADFITSLNLGIMDKQSGKWQLNIRRKVPQFVLTNNSTKSKQELKNVDEVMKLLGDRRAR